MRSGMVLVVAATLTLAACGSKSTSSAPPAASGSSSAPAPAASGSAPAPAASGSSPAAPGASGSAPASVPPASSAPSSSGTGASGLSIQPVSEISLEGKKVEAAAGATPVDPAGNGKATCSGVNIGMAGALTGPNAALGINIIDGMKVALDVHNKANAGCQVSVKSFDTEGDPQKATQVAPTIVADASVIGLLGPAFSGETKATEPIFFQAGLASLTASATAVALTTNGWTNFFRGLGNDASQGTAAAAYMTAALGYKKVCVVQDDSAYGVGLAAVVTKTLAGVADAACAGKVKTGDKDFSAVVNQVKTEAPDAVYYAGYYAEAAPFVSQLRSASVKATFVSGDGTNDPQFVKQAGSASKGALLTCPCGPATTAYAAAYQKLNGQAPGVYSVEGYDLATIMLKAIDSGVKTRAAMIAYVKSYKGVGLAKTYQWGPAGELAAASPWIYEVK